MREACSSPRSDREAGFALIGALWLSLALGLVGSLSLALAWRAVVRAELIVSEVEKTLSMDGALVRAVQELGLLPEHEVPFATEYKINGETTVVEARPANAWPDINVIDAVSLAGFLEVLGAGPDRAVALADTIADWREPRGSRRLNAATEADYRLAGLPLPRYAPFHTSAELALVHGLRVEEAECLASHVTVFSDAPEPDPALAAHPAMRFESLPPLRSSIAARWTLIASNLQNAGANKATVTLTSAAEAPVLVFEWNERQAFAPAKCFLH